MIGFLSGIWGRVGWALGLAALVLIGALMFQLERTQTKFEREREAKNVALSANEANSATISALESRISRDAALLRELRGIRAEIAQASDQRRADLDAIAETDDEAASFLLTPIPDSLRNAASGDADGSDNTADQ